MKFFSIAQYTFDVSNMLFYFVSKAKLFRKILASRAY